MPIPVTCPGCSSRMNAPDAAAGKKVKCPKCQTVLTVPAPVADFEVVEDEPVPPPKKPQAKPTAKPPVKVVVELDEDEEEDEKPQKRRAKAVVDDEEDEKPRKRKPQAEVDEDEDERPRKRRKAADEDDRDDDEKPRKKKKKAASGGASMARNIIGGVVLLILLGVAGFVFYDKLGKKEETVSNTPPSDDPSPQTPRIQGPAPKDLKPIIPNGPGPKLPGTDLGGKEDPHTGEGMPGGVIAEEDALISAVYEVAAFETPPQWYLSLTKDGPEGRPVFSARVFLRPEQHSKIADLWPDQRIKVRGRKVARQGVGMLGIEFCDFYAAEVVSSGPVPQFVEMTADQLLKEFRDNRAAAEKKWTRPTGGPDPPWIKLTGVFDGPGPKEIEWDTIQLKGDEPDGAKPNRIVVDTPRLIKPALKNLKKGDRITIRMRSLAAADSSAEQVRFLGGVFPLPK